MKAKTAILFFALLALPILAKAQDTTRQSGNFSFSSDLAGTWIINSDWPVKLDRAKWYELSSAINLMLQYADECYADSTFVEYWESTAPKTVLDSTGVSNWLSIHYYPKKVSKWIHRKPTFEGFVAWIREQGGDQ